MTTWQLLPQPQDLQPLDGTWTLDQRATIVLPAAANDDDLFAARLLQDSMAEYAGVSAPLEKRVAPDHPGPSLVLVRADRDHAWLPDAGVPSLHPEGYHLHIGTDGLLLVGADAPGLFYGVQTVTQLLDLAGPNLPALTITDYPAFPVRGVMLDVSRGKVPTVATVLEVVEHLASWKINQFQLYIEHVFAWPSHPKIGQGYDPLTPEDMLTIDEACARRHIEFVPNLQSFGHQAHLLHLHAYSHLAESEKQWTLSPAEPDTYALLDQLYAEFLPNFRSSLFNIDSDETYDLGKGKSAPRAAEVGLGRVYLDHILRLRELAAKYGRRIMFWGDIILHYPELIPEVPDDVTVLQWEYVHHPSEDSVRKFAEAGKPFYVCPGTNTWSAFFPRQDEARSNIRTLAAYGMQYGARGVLNTDWGDGGHYNLQGLSYYGYAFGAAESWHPGSTDGFEEAFGRLFFGVGWEAVIGAMHHLERVAEPAEGLRIADASALHRSFLRARLFRDTLTVDAAKVMRTNAVEAMELLKHVEDRTRHPLVVAEMALGALQDRLMAEKAELAVRFHRQYAALRARQDAAGLRALVQELRPQLQHLAQAANEIPDLFAPLWRARAREAGLQPVQEFQREVAADLEDAAAWMMQAAQTAEATGHFPELPEVSDEWRPKYWALQMG